MPCAALAAATVAESAEDETSAGEEHKEHPLDRLTQNALPV